MCFKQGSRNRNDRDNERRRSSVISVSATLARRVMERLGRAEAERDVLRDLGLRGRKGSGGVTFRL